jgi:hypothetical protein
MRHIGSGARRPPGVSARHPSGLPAVDALPLAGTEFRQAKRSFAESRVAKPCRWTRIGLALNCASTAGNAVVRNAG